MDKKKSTAVWGEEREGGGARTFLTAVAQTRRASGITMPTQTQTSATGVCVCVCRKTKSCLIIYIRNLKSQYFHSYACLIRYMQQHVHTHIQTHTLNSDTVKDLMWYFLCVSECVHRGECIGWDPGCVWWRTQQISKQTLWKQLRERNVQRQKDREERGERERERERERETDGGDKIKTITSHVSRKRLPCLSDQLTKHSRVHD